MGTNIKTNNHAIVLDGCLLSNKIVMIVPNTMTI